MASKMLPSKYVLASVAVSLGGLLNGFDTGSIGAITAMPQFIESLGKLSPTLLGFIVSVILLTGTVPSVFAGHLADKFGRLTVIFPGAILFGLGALVQGTSFSQSQLIVGRAICGLGEGIFLSIIATYICEVAPLKYRGTLAGLPQFLSVTGIALGYFTCYGSIYINSSFSWRLPFLLQVAVSALLAWCCFVLPESPRWLQVQGRRDDALRAFERLEVDMIEAERIMLSPTPQNLSLSPWQSLLLLFRKPYRARTILALFILGMVQLSGIDAILYYAPILFKQAGLSSENTSFLASGVSGILMLAISVPGFLLADKLGRRTSAITGGVILAGCMFLIGSLYAAGVVHPTGIARWVVIVSVFAFGLTYCVSWGIVGKIYASEIQPDHTRAAATCFAQGLGFFTNWLVAILAPILLDASSFAAYFLFGGLALSTVVVLAAYMPETRGRSLEDIQEAFHRPALSAVITGLRQSLRIRKRQVPITEQATELEYRNAASSGIEDTTSSAENVARSWRLDMTA
ncbi:general substrate transporter [Xylaria sp. FL0064]|nr:general substrate transporter [Xylaria sp. FL0064]